MTNNGLANWGKRYGLTLAQVKRLQRWISRYATQRERYCNGDPHPNVANREDKNANAQAWDKTSERTAASLTTLITSFGFDGIDFGVGLYPALAKDGDTCVMVPDVDDAD